MNAPSHTSTTSAPNATILSSAMHSAENAVKELGAAHIKPVTSLLALDLLPRLQISATVNTAFIQGTVTYTVVLRRQSELKQIETAALHPDTAGGYAGGVLRGVVASVDGVKLNVEVDAFSNVEQALNALLEWPGVGQAMQKKYYDTLFHEKEKN